MLQGFGHGRKGWTEHGSMCKGNKVGQFGSVKGSMGSVFSHQLYV